MDDKKLLLADDHLALVFPYNKEQVADIKCLVPGARWDGPAKTWRAPLRSIYEATDFAKMWDFDIDPELAGLSIPDRPQRARVAKGEKGIHVTFPYDKIRIASVRTITGMKWDKKEAAWIAPLSSAPEVVEWADDFDIDIDRGLRERVSATTDARSGLLVLSGQNNLKEPLDTSELAGTLLPFQHVAVQYALETRRTFIADPMGLGKTVEAITALKLGRGLPAVVVCPPTLVLNWVKEIGAWLPDAKIATLSGLAKKPLTDKVRKSALWEKTEWNAKYVALDTKTDPEQLASFLNTADFIILGYSTVGAWRPVLADIAHSLVCDESQYVKNDKAKRTKATVKLAKGLPEDGMVLCLTGTPVLNRPAEFASQLDVLGRISDFGGKWAFYRRFCGAFKDKYGKWDISGSSHRQELNELLRSTCYVRRVKEEVLKDLPPIRHQVVPVQGDAAVMKEYRKAEDDIARYMAERAAEIARELGENPRSAAVMARIKAEAAEHIVRLSALRRIAAKAKMPAIAEMVQNHVDEGSKVVIAAHHREVVTGLADLYGGYKIQGGMAVDEVETMKARFQDMPASEVPVMVLSIQAAKTGHTLTAAQDILIAELPWTPADADQVIARLHRIGQEGSVMATWILCDNTIDHEMHSLLASKRAVVDAVTEGGEMADTGGVVGGLLVSLTQQGLDLSE